MLRVFQQAQSKLQGVSQANLGSFRAFSAITWPAEIPVPEGAKSYNPDGPLTQFDALAANQDRDDPHVKVILEMRDLKANLQKLEMENKTRSDAAPPGLVTLADGSIDKEHYVKKQGMHPSFVTELEAIMTAEAKTHIRPKQDNEFEDLQAKLKPAMDKERERLVTEVRQLEAKKKDLDDFRERLEEITVDEMLEKYPELAQEIKDEIEAGIWHPTDAGFKIPDKALTT